MELARLITAENDHVDLIGSGMELDAQASARHLEKRGADSAFCSAICLLLSDFCLPFSAYRL